MGLDVYFRHDIGNQGKAAKLAHDPLMALSIELVGDDPIKLAILHAYDRGFYASLISTQAAAGNVPSLASGHTVQQVQEVVKALPSGDGIQLSEVVLGFIPAEK